MQPTSMPRFFCAMTLPLLMFACSSGASKPTSDDPYLWLESVHDEDALDWAKDQSKKTRKALKDTPLYPRLYDDFLDGLQAQDRIPAPTILGKYVYNFWKDSQHPKGLWRRTSESDYAKASPSWELVLDLDALAKQENENWIWHAENCLPPAYQKCLIEISRGGKDAKVIREFDTVSKSFVADGFQLPEAKAFAYWFDADTIWVGTDFGPGTLSPSGYPLITKLWKRGTPLSEAKKVFEGQPNDLEVDGYTTFAADEKPVHILSRLLNSFESERSIYTPADGKIHRIPFPATAKFYGIFRGHVLARLRRDWTGPKDPFPAGALVSIPLDEILRDSGKLTVQTVYFPGRRSALNGFARSSDSLYLEVLEDVKGKVVRVQRDGKFWRTRTLPLPDEGTLKVAASDSFSRGIYVSYESFLIPPTLYGVSSLDASAKAVKSLPARFDGTGLEVRQYESVSKDGTRIPYFLVRKKGMPYDRNSPTLVFAYGGFEVSKTPFYSLTLGKGWLEKGGTYALASIRGGGELGPQWHEAAMLKKRQTSFDDLISVAADLFRLHVTRPSRLALWGGSNGGLLMAGVLTQRPDLFQAAVIERPLTDMLRYTKMSGGAGASWMGEYGNPDDPEMAQVLAKYSPYQNVKTGVKYPRALFVSSAADDRVIPAHARKMVAKLQASGHDTYYLEETEGGHADSASLEQEARLYAMKYAYLWVELGAELGSEPGSNLNAVAGSAAAGASATSGAGRK